MSDKFPVDGEAVGSGVQPGLEEGIQTLQHFFFDALDVGEAAPKGEIQFLTHALKLRDELFYQSALVTVLLPEVLLAGLRRLFLPVLGAECHGV